MKKIKVDYKVQFDYHKVFGDWVEPLKKLFQSDYMYNLTVFLHELYSIKLPLATPRKNEIYQAFQSVPFKNVRVVVLNGEPPIHGKGNGVGLATSLASFGSPSIQTLALEKCIERTIHRGLLLEFDYTLEHWMRQGVIPLHTTLTTEFGKSTHRIYWRNFVREVIKGISDNSTGIIFILLGPKARYFKKFISETNHYVLEYHHPKYSIDRKQDWNCPCFKQANDILKANNGKDLVIKW